MNPFVNLIVNVISLYNLILFIYIVLSWLIGFGIVNKNQPVVRKVYDVLARLTEPVLARIRRYMPDLGGIDLSPIVLLFVLYFLQDFLVYYLG